MANRIRKNRRFFKDRKWPPDGQEPPNRAGRQRLNRMKKGIFILPSLLTLTSIFLSFYSTIASIKGEYVLAGALILGAGFFDGVDGKVARLTKTTTRFGLELDSLADVISFGMAPAILVYTWALEPYGQIGWVSAFVFVSCGALRLARFNVQSGVIDPKRFNGLPIPAAAAMIATTVLFCHKLQLDPVDLRLFILILVYVISFLMVSGVKFHAFKDLTLVKEKPFSSTVGFVLVLALIAVSPYVVPFLLCAAYTISGPVLTLAIFFRNRKTIHEPLPETGIAASGTNVLESNQKI
jgi:CDP-diacylglycerol---serine O-phosphatidyltransferase